MNLGKLFGSVDWAAEAAKAISFLNEELPSYATMSVISVLTDHPDWSESQVVDEAFGRVRHYLRGQIGAGVDLLFNVGDFSHKVRDAVGQAAVAIMDLADASETAPASTVPASALTAAIAKPAASTATSVATVKPFEQPIALPAKGGSDASAG